jgi:plasmid stability protein
LSQLTIRNLPPEIEQAIRRRARERHISINQSITELLSEAMGIPKSGEKQRDLSDLAGTWSDEEAQEFEEALRRQRGIDEEIWQR